MITEDYVESDTVEIEAPVELVWEILLDFTNYEKWNEFCPRVHNDALEPGAAVDMMVDLGNGLTRQLEYITLVEPGKTIAWGMENKPGDPIHAVRTQSLTSLGPERCSYVTFDQFSGVAVPDMMKIMAKPVEDGFNKCAYGLKAYAESLHGGEH